MKIYKKTVVLLSILTALPLLAATEDKDAIYVNTFVDEDGENNNACSLREALTAAATNKAYGGCSVGKTSSGSIDNIQLQEGVYQLKKTLKPESMVHIHGKDPRTWDHADVINNKYPALQALKTTIQGDGSFILLDTLKSLSSLTLTDLKLEGGYSETTGGSINAGGNVSLNRVEISNSTAKKEGGAIYLSGINSTLQAENSTISSSIAPKGAVLSMSCLDKLNFTKRTLSLTSSSIVNNGDASTKSIIEFCGEAEVTASTNTIAQNTASSTDGSILKFTADSIAGQNTEVKLSSQSSLELKSNTIVENTAHSTFLYDSIGNKSLSYNILAFNKGYSCRHLMDASRLEENATASFTLSYNGLNLSSSNDGYCSLPEAVAKNSTIKKLDNYSFASLMTNLEPASAITAYKPMYFLRNTGSNPLVDASGNTDACSTTDQRGVARLVTSVNLLEENQNSCELGSTELVRLAVSDIENSNASQVSLLQGYQDDIDLFQSALDNPSTNPDYINYYKIMRDENKSKLENTKKSLRYRQVYFDVFANSVPQEKELNNGSREIEPFATGDYTVTTEELGTGPNVFSSGIASDLYTLVKPDDKVKCEWDSQLKLLLMYRTDGAVSQDGDYSYCKFTVSYAGSNSSVGVAKAQFVNIAPIANNDSGVFKYGTEQRVKLNLLDNDHDDGDGSKTVANYPSAKSAFYVNQSGITTPIKFSSLDSNLTLEAQYSAPCPDGSDTTCYGGEIYIKPKNIFNVFGYTLKYTVFDADGAASNEAEISLVNSEDKQGSSGGGALGVFSLLALTTLAGLRYRKFKEN